jgi:hypothetical protein
MIVQIIVFTSGIDVSDDAPPLPYFHVSAFRTTSFCSMLLGRLTVILQ